MRTSDCPLETLFLRYCTHADVAALGRVFDALAPHLAAVALHLAPTRTDAEDLLQATFLTALRRADSFDASRRLAPWMVGILVRTASARRRRAGRDGHAPLEDDAALAAEAPADDAERAERARAVHQAVARLPEGLRGLVELQLHEGLRPAEIAARLDVDARSVRVRLHRARGLLRGLLPAGLAGGAAVALAPRSLAGVRARVVREAARAAGLAAPAAISTGLTTGLTTGRWAAVGLAAAAAVAVLATLVPEPRGTTPAPLAGPARARLDLDATAQLARGEPVAPPARLDERRPAAGPAADAKGPATSAQAPAPALLVCGRLLTADGVPAAGMPLELTSSDANNELVLLHGAPPELQRSATCDADGRFELAYEPHPAAQYFLRATSARYGAAAWRWSTQDRFLPGAERGTLDLGEVRLPPTGRVEGVVLGARGPWEVFLREEGQSGDLRSGALFFGTTDSAGDFSLPAVPEGRFTLVVSAGAASESREGTVRAGETTRVELSPPAPAEGVLTVRVGLAPPHSLPAEGARVLLLDAAGRAIEPASASARGGTRYEGLDAAPYTAVVECAGCERWTQGDVLPARTPTLVAHLSGDARLAVTLRDARTGEPLVGARLGQRAGTRVALLGTSDEQGVVRGLGTQPSGRALTLEVVSAGRPRATLELPPLAPGEQRACVLDVDPGTRLVGIVRHADGSPASDCTVQRTRGLVAALGPNESTTGSGRIPGYEDEVRTDGAGRFVLAAVPPGPQTLCAADGPWCIAVQVLAEGADPEREVVLTLPAAGFAEGPLTLPECADLDRLQVRIGRTDGVPAPWSPFAVAPAARLVRDGVLRLGPLPPGRYAASVRTKDRGELALGAPIPLAGEFTIEAGATTPVVADLRQRWPGRLALTARIDGERALAGRMFVHLPNGSSAERELEGDGVEWTDVPVGACAVAYIAPDRSWSAGPEAPVPVTACEMRRFELTVSLAQRRVVFVDAAGGAPLAERGVAWRTGPPMPNPCGAAAVTDADGALTLRLPEGPVAFRLDAGVEERAPTEVTWTRGADELVVRLRAE